MSKKTVSRLSAHLVKSVSLCALVALVAGCAPGTVRFTDGFYTAAVPKNSVGPVQTPFPTAATPQVAQAPVQAYPQPVYQPQPQVQPVYQQPVYQAQAPVYAPQTPYPAGVDQTYTASVAPVQRVIQQQPVIQQPIVRQPVIQQPIVRQPVVAAPVVTPKAVVAPQPQPQTVKLLEPMRVPVPKVRQVAQKTAPMPIPQQRTDSIQTASISPQAAMVPAPISQPIPSAPTKEGWTAAGGTFVTMRQGETIYNLAKRYGVPANAIMEANNLRDATSVSTGSRIIIPTYVYSRTAPISAPDASAAVRSASSNIGSRSSFPMTIAPIPTRRPQGSVQVASIAPKTAMVDAATPQANGAVGISTGRYKVVSGDTLSGIASRSSSSVSAIKRLNGMSSDSLRVGQTLLIPGIDGNPNAAQVASVNIDPVTTSNGAKIQNSGSIATVASAQSAAAPAQTGVSTMRWPVSGRVISGFGSNVGGKANDGIDISVPPGSSVKAAENGVVIYAGDGLKEFGKTVLVRHGNGLVTVYGHLSKINVSRGDTISRGQMVGASGMTGSAKQPQLHFEVRKNTSPVNPMTYLR